MEVLKRCQTVAVIDSLRNIASRRTATELSLICAGRGENLDKFSAVQKFASSFRVSGGIGSTERGRWQEGEDGASRRCKYCIGERVGVRGRGNEQSDVGKGQRKVCVRCGMAYRDEDNSPVACKYHGHMTEDRGLYALAPPHQGIDGEWTDSSEVIVYKWNDEDNRPSTGSKKWKKRWTCCGDYAEDAAPCRSGSHVSYDDGATRF